MIWLRHLTLIMRDRIWTLPGHTAYPCVAIPSYGIIRRPSGSSVSITTRTIPLRTGRPCSRDLRAISAVCLSLYRAIIPASYMHGMWSMRSWMTADSDTHCGRRPSERISLLKLSNMPASTRIPMWHSFTMITRHHRSGSGTSS